MAISAKQYAEALLAGTQEIAEKDYDKVINNLIEILKANNDLNLFEKIITEFEILSASVQHSAKITSAQPLNVDKDILTSLNKLAGEKLTTESEIDESLIGGVVIRIDDTLIDASIKNSLNNLKTKLES